MTPVRTEPVRYLGSRWRPRPHWTDILVAGLAFDVLVLILVVRAVTTT